MHKNDQLTVPVGGHFNHVGCAFKHTGAAAAAGHVDGIKRQRGDGAKLLPMAGGVKTRLSYGRSSSGTGGTDVAQLTQDKASAASVSF